MATIEDVAKAAGVSTATVSRVLNSTCIVSKNTKEKVLAAVEKCGYQANILGRALRAKKTKMVLVILSTIVNSFYAKVIKGIEDVAEQNGYHILIGTNYDSPERERDYLGLLKNRLADGAILLRPSVPVDEIRSLGKIYPIIECGEYTTGIPYVSIDNSLAAYEMTTALINRGFKRIALLRSDDEGMSNVKRVAGYKKALYDNNLEFDESLVIYGNYGFKNAYRNVTEFLKTKKADAIFALSDRMAAGAIDAAQSLGMDVPGDISVAGFDNVDISYMVSPNITTVSQNQQQMGQEAMKKLIAMMHGERNIKSKLIKHEIIWRQSVVV